MSNESSFTVGHAGLQDFVLSPDGHTIYVADADGMIRAYDARTHEQTNAWRVGGDLGGIDITPDGKTIVAVEDQTVFHKQGTSFDEIVSHAAYTLDLATGTVAPHLYTVDEYYPDGFFDIATTSDGHAILSGDDQWGYLTDLNLQTGALNKSGPQVNTNTLRASVSHNHIVVLENGISDARLDVFSSGTGITASHNNYADGVQGFNNGIAAIDDAKGLIAQGLGSTVNIYDLNLHFKFNLNTYKSLGLGSVNGLAFSADGTSLYILDQGHHTIVTVDTSVWEPTATYDLGVNSIGDVYGNGLVASADGSYLAFVAADGVHVVDITQGQNTISGTPGDDAMAGGVGNDTYVVNSKGDVVTENANEGYDVVRSSIHYQLRDNVEGLQLVDSASKGAGNALDNTLGGNDQDNQLIGFDGRDSLSGGLGNDMLKGGRGNDVLDGGAGDDTLVGGAGDDRYIGNSGGDTIVEVVKHGGTDTVEASVNYTLADNVEDLLLTGTGSHSGTGNAGDNRIVGTIGDNLLTGLGGNDVLEAGGGGFDRMLGGDGADTFHFGQLDPSGASYANANSIADFNSTDGDRIDLSSIDADIFTAGDQAFSFIGTAAFSGTAGQLQVVHYTGNTYVQGDLNGDQLIDFVIKLDGNIVLGGGDFFL